jgi:single-strand DNA-binding protein
MNKVILIGRLGQDPKTANTQTGTTIVNFSLATDESYTGQDGNKVEKTEWHRIVTFGKQAEFCSNYLSKGRLVLVEGSLQTRKWQDQEGRDRYTTEIKARSIQALDPKTQQRPMDDGWGKDLGDDYFSKESDTPSSEPGLPKSKMDDDLGEQGPKRDPFDAPF